jgi:hypothetical protein
MRRARYRLAQFIHFLWPQPLDAAAWAEVQAVLGPRLTELFARQSAGEQAHSLQVLRALRRGGHAQPELLQAALLHDVGKSRAPLSLPGRVWVVLANWLAPRQAARWGQAAAPPGWARPFVTAARHPEWGAELCAQAGAAPVVAELVRWHQAPGAAALTGPAADWLRCLQAADDDS